MFIFVSLYNLLYTYSNIIYDIIDNIFSRNNFIRTQSEIKIIYYTMEPYMNLDCIIINLLSLYMLLYVAATIYL